MSQSVDTADIKKMNDLVNKIHDEFRKLKYSANYNIANEMSKIVKKNIAISINDVSGKIAGWQIAGPPHFNVRGGYAVIAPQRNSYGTRYPSPGANSPGAVTNYLENGHSIRTIVTGRGKNKQTTRIGNIPGRHFYKNSEKEIISYASQAYTEVLNKLADYLNK